MNVFVTFTAKEQNNGEKSDISILWSKSEVDPFRKRLKGNYYKKGKWWGLKELGKMVNFLSMAQQAHDYLQVKKNRNII